MPVNAVIQHIAGGGAFFSGLVIVGAAGWLGAESLSPASQRFLQQHRLSHRRFENAFHWVMLDSTDEFYQELECFLLAP